jgi:hypothetical protein
MIADPGAQDGHRACNEKTAADPSTSGGGTCYCCDKKLATCRIIHLYTYESALESIFWMDDVALVLSKVTE